MGLVWLLDQWMEIRGVTNAQLAEATGYHPKTISKLRNNLPGRIDIETLAKLCIALECQPGDLIRFEKPKA